jgi:hypothetical protein
MISLRAIEMIEMLKNAPWFEHVGMPLEDDTAVPVYSWGQSMKLCLSYDWKDDVLIDARNGLSMILDRDHTKRYQDWNEIIDSIDECLKPAMEELAKLVIEDHDLPEEFKQVLVSTTRMACVEAEYSDIVPPAFFMEIAKWYIAGHLPCGLTEEYPNGKLMVF